MFEPKVLIYSTNVALAFVVSKTRVLVCLCIAAVAFSFVVQAPAPAQARASAIQTDIRNNRNNALSHTTATAVDECVILLHGLARSASSMNVMETALLSAGYSVVNIDYPSRKKTIQELAGPAIDEGVSKCKDKHASNIHVVTHSMGGILYRQCVAEKGATAFKRIVMLAPPNKGSEVVDTLKGVSGFEWLNGPAGSQLGTGKNSIPLTLGPAENDIAIVAGTFSINLMFSSYLPNPDDGKVSVESTKLEGMCAHLQVNVSHPFIMKDKMVIKEVIAYLDSGRFINSDAEYPDCRFRVSM